MPSFRITKREIQDENLYYYEQMQSICPLFFNFLEYCDYYNFIKTKDFMKLYNFMFKLYTAINENGIDDKSTQDLFNEEFNNTLFYFTIKKFYLDNIDDLKDLINDDTFFIKSDDLARNRVMAQFLFYIFGQTEFGTYFTKIYNNILHCKAKFKTPIQYII